MKGLANLVAKPITKPVPGHPDYSLDQHGNLYDVNGRLYFKSSDGAQATIYPTGRATLLTLSDLREQLFGIRHTARSSLSDSSTYQVPPTGAQMCSLCVTAVPRPQTCGSHSLPNAG